MFFLKYLKTIPCKKLPDRCACEVLALFNAIEDTYSILLYEDLAVCDTYNISQRVVRILHSLSSNWITWIPGTYGQCTDFLPEMQKMAAMLIETGIHSKFVVYPQLITDWWGMMRWLHENTRGTPRRDLSMDTFIALKSNVGDFLSTMAGRDERKQAVAAGLLACTTLPELQVKIASAIASEAKMMQTPDFPDKTKLLKEFKDTCISLGRHNFEMPRDAKLCLDTLVDFYGAWDNWAPTIITMAKYPHLMRVIKAIMKVLPGNEAAALMDYMDIKNMDDVTYATDASLRFLVEGGFLNAQFLKQVAAFMKFETLPISRKGTLSLARWHIKYMVDLILYQVDQYERSAEIQVAKIPGAAMKVVEGPLAAIERSMKGAPHFLEHQFHTLEMAVAHLKVDATNAKATFSNAWRDFLADMK
jgi:hypothetical protein